ncbi:MAG TPA: CaiB/BaiF CoA-transferase family protein [Flavisolibacter sp.]|nr:CaiB/BaiF CoA-transferase family protein [Flavisolibacter sp.]
MKLLEDILVLDFSQFLSGPSASLRLADMGARVIKIEKPGEGDICRDLYVSDVDIEGESTIFHAINRNKESYVADLKKADDLERIKQLISEADVVMHNFRPGVMQRLGLDYETVRKINPTIVYAEISGYGDDSPWRNLPGQDLLLQAVSGLTWLSHNGQEMPTPMGVAVVDILAGAHTVQGILAALFQRGVKNTSALVQVSMFESILDFQFEVLTCFYNDGEELPQRSRINNAHAYISAPYGIYKTADGYLALAMGDIQQLAALLACDGLLVFTDKKDWFTKRDEIKKVLADHLLTGSTDAWLSILQPADIWCAPVYNYETLRQQEGYKAQNVEMEVTTSNGISLTTTRCPIKVDGQYLTSSIGAPFLGEHTENINKEFSLNVA